MPGKAETNQVPKKTQDTPDFTAFLSSTLRTYRDLSCEQQVELLDALLVSSRARQRWCVLQQLPALLSRDFVSLLSPELVSQVMGHLDGESLLRCCRVSRNWRHVLCGLSPLWRRLCLQAGVLVDDCDDQCGEYVDWRRVYVLTLRRLSLMSQGRLFRHGFLQTSSVHAGGRMIAVDHDRGHIAAANEFGRVFLWRIESGDYEGGDCVLQFSVSTPVSCVRLDIGGGLLLCGHYNGALSYYNVCCLRLEQQQCLNVPTGGPGRERYDDDWLTDRGAMLCSYTSHTGPVFSMDIDCKHDVLVSGSADSTVKVFQVSAKYLIVTLAAFSHWVVCTRLCITDTSNSSCVQLLAMTRNDLSVYQATCNYATSSVAETLGNMHVASLVIPLAATSSVSVVDIDALFFTPGCHVIGNCVYFITQQATFSSVGVSGGDQCGAAVKCCCLNTGRVSTLFTVHFCVKKLLAIGDRFAILLSPVSGTNGVNLHVVDVLSGQIVSSDQVPHSRVSTPDAAQIVAPANQRWLDGFSVGRLLGKAARDRNTGSLLLVAAMGTQISRQVFLLSLRTDYDVYDDVPL